MVNPFRLLVFDWDGTLMDSEAHIVASMQAACEDLGTVALGYDTIKNIIGLGLHQAIATLLPDGDAEFRERLADRYRHHFITTSDAGSRFFPGVEDTLRSLQDQGYFLAVATGKSRRGLSHVLDRIDFRDCFHATRCADETRSKPDPEMLLQLMDELGVDPTDTLMIGDTEYDMEMAISAGASCMAVSYGVHEPERLLRYRPLACLDRISELLEWLETEFVL